MRKQQMKPTRRQIEEAIGTWTRILLENGMATSEEVSQMLDEGKVKRGIAHIKGAFKKVASTVKAAAEAVHDVIRPNKGAKMLFDALDKLAKNKIDLGIVKIWASLGEDKFYPVVDYIAKTKEDVILIVNPENPSAQPKLMKDFRQFLRDKCDITGNVRVTDAIESISLAKINNAAEKKLNESIEVILESKLTDYIEKNKLTKEKALSGDAFKAIKKLIKQGDEKTKQAIEKAFAKIEAAKKPASKEQNKEAKTAASKEPAQKKEDIAKPTFTMLDNKLLDVIPKQKNVGFKFSKSKAEIEMDYAFANSMSK